MTEQIAYFEWTGATTGRRYRLYLHGELKGWLAAHDDGRWIALRIAKRDDLATINEYRALAELPILAVQPIPDKL